MITTNVSGSFVYPSARARINELNYLMEKNHKVDIKLYGKGVKIMNEPHYSLRKAFSYLGKFFSGLSKKKLEERTMQKQDQALKAIGLSRAVMEDQGIKEIYNKAVKFQILENIDCMDESPELDKPHKIEKSQQGDDFLALENLHVLDNLRECGLY